MRDETKALIVVCIFVLAFVIYSNIASAQEMQYWVKTNNNVTISDTCTINGFVCDNSYECNITIKSPDNSFLISNQPMYRAGQTINYNLTSSQTSTDGEYQMIDYCTNGTYSGSGGYFFGISLNGKAPPTDVLLTFFVITFILILTFSIYMIIHSIGHAITLDFDIIDLAINMGVYIGVVGLFLVEKFYIANPVIEPIMEWFVYIGAITNAFLPTLYFILTLTVGTWMSGRVKGVDYA